MISISCDGCGCDLTDSAGYPRYRLKLSIESIPNLSTNYECDVHVLPMLKGTKHYCSIECLKTVKDARAVSQT